jgi:hypothetical protein
MGLIGSDRRRNGQDHHVRRAKYLSLGAIPQASSRIDSVPPQRRDTWSEAERYSPLCDPNREALGLRQLPSTTKLFGCDYDLARAPSSRINDFVADPRGIVRARRIKKAAA